MLYPAFLLRLFFEAEDGGNMTLDINGLRSLISKKRASFISTDVRTSFPTYMEGKCWEEAKNNWL
jgi:hypothetical protein